MGLTKANLAARKAAGYPITCSELGAVMKGGSARATIIDKKVTLRTGGELPDFQNAAMRRGAELERDAYRYIAARGFPKAWIRHNRDFFTREISEGVLLGGTPDIVGEEVGDIKIPANEFSFARQTRRGGGGIYESYKWQTLGQALLMGVDKAMLAFVRFDDEDIADKCVVFDVLFGAEDKARIISAIVDTEMCIRHKIESGKKKAAFG